MESLQTYSFINYHEGEHMVCSRPPKPRTEMGSIPSTFAKNIKTMINKQEILRIVTEYTHIGNDFCTPIYDKTVYSDFILHAAKMYFNFGRHYTTEQFTKEFFTYGQVLPRACGKSSFLKNELIPYLFSLGYKMRPVINGEICLMFKGNKNIILQSDGRYGDKINLSNFRGVGSPILRILLHTPVR